MQPCPGLAPEPEPGCIQEPTASHRSPGLPPVELAVREAWRAMPGIGIQALVTALTTRFPQEAQEMGKAAFKKRLKAARDGIPYRRGEDLVERPDFDQHTLVTVLLEQRQSFRAARQWDRADRILEGLENIGVNVDDRLKTWHLGPCPRKLETPVGTLVSVESGVACRMCGNKFGSRNLLFRHLRDPVTGCGLAVAAAGGIAASPMQQAKSATKTARQAIRVRSGVTARHAPADCCLWLGNIPLVWSTPSGRYKRLQSLLYAHVPQDVPRPWIKTVVRKAYREKESPEGDGAYLGYAIIVLRDAKEAAYVLSAMDGATVSAKSVYRTDQLAEVSQAELTDVVRQAPFQLKVRAADNGDSAPAQSVLSSLRSESDCSKGQVIPGLDPPLIEQLRPLPDVVLHERLLRLQKLPSMHTGLGLSTAGLALHEEKQKCAGSDEDVSICDRSQQNGLSHDELLDRVVTEYSRVMNARRREIYLHGRPLPIKIKSRILELLRELRWPAQNQRQGMSAERYLVLPSNVNNDRHYADLRAACKELMAWAAPEYVYSAIAVTKNFVASPHIDDRDCTFQYAVSLGDFEYGGQLCVEGPPDEDVIAVVDTRGKIAKVDGRHVHWVRTWSTTGSGRDEKPTKIAAETVESSVCNDRYSLIFYNTSQAYSSPVLHTGWDADWMAQ